MKELVFSIKDVFDTNNQSGCLHQYNAHCFHIPAYQRGYKWGSGPKGAVTVLLEDLWGKFEQEADEYYLQYITVKPIQLDGRTCLEVIDGQQRLTTLSILISVISALIDSNEKNIAVGKLNYAIRDNFFKDFVYQADALLETVSRDWEDFISPDIDRLDRQDIYYLFSAAKACYEILVDEHDNLRAFQDFLLGKVKLIINSIEPHIQSETVFKNLNSNKVPLTETELIKALLITRVGRAQVRDADNHFRQVIEVRLGISRVWEGIQEWSQRPEIRSYYFDDKHDALYELLRLTSLQMGLKKIGTHVIDSNSEHPLFNFFNKDSNADIGLEKLIEIQQRLEDFFNNDELYHLLGFCRFVKGSKRENLMFLNDCLGKENRTQLVNWLNQDKNKAIVGPLAKKEKYIEIVKGLHYGENTNQIHAVLLALSVFPNTVPRPRFNFDAFKRENWSLEHIFPQSPEGKGHVLVESEKRNILKMIKEPTIELKKIIEQENRSPEEQKTVTTALHKSGKLDSIGNMCLLTGGANSALGCQFFSDKRSTILSLIQRGSFVPKHTFDVFSKMVTGLDDNLKQWSTTDIDQHADQIAKTVVKAAMECC
jgi:hypothetical protein